jgi:predicted acylesterase/phospholipase RssA
VRVNTPELRDHRRAFHDLEQRVVERCLARPGELTDELVDGLRYVINFAKLTVLRDEQGVDHSVAEMLRTHAWRVRDTLAPRLAPDEPNLWPALRSLPEMVRSTRELRQRLIQSVGISPERVRKEVCEKKLIVVLGGGGGAGYGYGGIFTRLDHQHLAPSLVCGTSIGALACIFRARRTHHDPAAIIDCMTRLTWQRVFSLGSQASRYGLPATLRLQLRRAVSQYFLHPDGSPIQIGELAIPAYIVATGLRMDALKHDLSWYEHFLDDAVSPGPVFRATRLRKLRNLASIFRELMADQDALHPMVFGRDAGTHEIDVVDAAGFSAAVPGLIHYDIVRDDQRMKHLLDALYSEYGITRLTEGGIVDNLPARVGWEAAMAGELDGHRNVHVLAVDCFTPKPSSVIFFPVQQAVRSNVTRNLGYVHTYVPLTKTLSPLNLVPAITAMDKAGRWAVRDFDPHLPLMGKLCRTFGDLRP